jgi:hypothetical protein
VSLMRPSAFDLTHNSQFGDIVKLCQSVHNTIIHPIVAPVFQYVPMGISDSC